MPLWPRKRRVGTGDRRIVRAQKARFEITMPAGQTAANRTALEQELNAAAARHRAAVEEIARRHGAEFRLLEDD
jgi:hypothetical protein